MLECTVDSSFIYKVMEDGGFTSIIEGMRLDLRGSRLASSLLLDKLLGDIMSRKGLTKDRYDRLLNVTRCTAYLLGKEIDIPMDYMLMREFMDYTSAIESFNHSELEVVFEAGRYLLQTVYYIASVKQEIASNNNDDVLPF